MVRAEEITLSVRDGRRVTTLVNATPIRSADGAVESMVVTLQDLAPLEELERQRAEFLSMVSHELRTPLSSIKGSAVAVLGASRPPDLAETRQFFRVIDEQADQMLGLIGDLLDQGASRRERCRSRSNRRRWPAWWTRPEASFSPAAVGTRSASTCRRTYRG